MLLAGLVKLSLFTFIYKPAIIRTYTMNITVCLNLKKITFIGKKQQFIIKGTNIIMSYILYRNYYSSNTKVNL